MFSRGSYVFQFIVAQSSIVYGCVFTALAIILVVPGNESEKPIISCDTKLLIIYVTCVIDDKINAQLKCKNTLELIIITVAFNNRWNAIGIRFLNWKRKQSKCEIKMQKLCTKLMNWNALLRSYIDRFNYDSCTENHVKNGSKYGKERAREIFKNK